jgi:hypothetical protein
MMAKRALESAREAHEGSPSPRPEQRTSPVVRSPPAQEPGRADLMQQRCQLIEHWARVIVKHGPEMESLVVSRNVDNPTFVFLTDIDSVDVSTAERGCAAAKRLPSV